MARNYLGLSSTFHDSAIAIVDGQGKLVFAEGTERVLQNKRALNCAPDIFQRTSDLIKEYCDQNAELVVGFSWSDKHVSSLQRSMLAAADAKEKVKAQFGDIPVFLRRAVATSDLMHSAQLAASFNCGNILDYELALPGSRRHGGIIKRRYDHHLTHAAAACFTSPFEHAACAVIDGYGEERSMACYEYRRGRLRELDVVYGRVVDSLGMFYSYVCELCGFSFLAGDDWKVMGLAAYGKPDEEIYELLREMIGVNDLSIESCDDATAMRNREKLYHLRRKEGETAVKVADVAYAGQKVLEETMFEFLNNLYKRGVSDNLAVGGGCFLNSSANGRILQNTPFRNLHAFSAPADDGNAVGAALLAYQQDHADYRPSRQFQTPYLGSVMSAETMANVAKFGKLDKLVTCRGEAPEKAASLLADGKIIGWIQGRAEFGPRALGNRSILADPRSPEIKDVINARVKFREEFRPFAPSILHEFGAEYFEDYQESPYMERTLKFRQAVRDRVPGVVHLDGTGRLQTVKREWNDGFYRLIREFHRLTKIPLVLNTSFNVMGKPISHSVEDVLAVFYTSGLDAVFVDDVLLEK